jgi:hypothetical protein
MCSSSSFTVGPVDLPTVGTDCTTLLWVSLVSTRRAPRTDVARDLWQRKGELWARNVRVNLACNCDFLGNCKDLLHAAKLRHGIDGFTSPPKEGSLRIFRPKNPTASAGFGTWVPETSALTTRPQQPLGYLLLCYMMPKGRNNLKKFLLA